MNDTNDTKPLGNTKPMARGRKWCFTLNNPSKYYRDYMIDTLTQKHTMFIIGNEIGENNTPHLQGYIEFKNPVAFNSLKNKFPQAHFEKARGTRDQNIAYCSKQNDFINTFPLPLKIQILEQEYKNVEWKPWQQGIIDLLETKPDHRTINWYWEPIGNTGKSYLCKYLALTKNIIIAEGKKDNIFNQIKTWMDQHEGEAPNIILCDVPRTNIDYINYTAIESIKNGLIYSGKYEGGMCAFPIPHVIIFANTPPITANLSEDRWNIIKIEN